MRVECWPAHLAGGRPVTGPGNGRLLCKRSDSRAAEVFFFLVSLVAMESSLQRGGCIYHLLEWRERLAGFTHSLDLALR